MLLAKPGSDPSGHIEWSVQEETLEISGATALEVDIMENKIYWINKTQKVSSDLYTFILYNIVHTYVLTILKTKVQYQCEAD